MSKAPVIVAIDGPSGVGKSTVAKLLAKRLRLPMLNTGAMYRAVALQAMEEGVDPADRKAMRRLVREIDLELRTAGDGGVEVLLRGEPVGQKIRSPEIARQASVVSAHSTVRKRMVELQRTYARRGGAVLEGRDIGTVVFPETPFKFFLDARVDVRAERRHRELVAAGRGSTLEEVTQDLEERDRRDRTREDSPLVQDESHFEIDSSDLLPAEIVERMVGIIRRHQEQEETEDPSATAGEPAVADAAGASDD